MADREKVIKAFEVCTDVNGNCYECPYTENGENPEQCNQQALKDALSLLKAQEPRVMTLDEVVKHYSLPPVVLDDLGWQEDYLQDIEPLYFEFPVNDSWAVHWRGYQQVRAYINDWKPSYGQKWRCWTSRPTDEQREAVKWDG